MLYHNFLMRDRYGRAQSMACIWPRGSNNCVTKSSQNLILWCGLFYLLNVEKTSPLKLDITIKFQQIICANNLSFYPTYLPSYLSIFPTYLPTYLSYLPIFPTYLSFPPTYLPTYLSYLPTFLYFLPSYLPSYIPIFPTFLPTYLSFLPTYLSATKSSKLIREPL